MKIVGIGGGTGLPVLLRGLRELAGGNRSPGGDDDISPTAVVCVSDNGGSSGILRQAYGIPAVGDLRNCLVALSSARSTLTDLFQLRISGCREFGGHPLGNLIMTALTARLGSLREAVHCAAGLLQSKGDVLPVTEENATLCAEFQDGTVARGETEIVTLRMRIRRVWLEPENPPPSPGVIQQIQEADAIVLGPGSLYTSILPNLFPAGVAEAIRTCRALKIYVSNLMTEPGETAGFSAADHLHVLNAHLGARALSVCLMNSRQISQPALSNYRRLGADVVRRDDTEIVGQGSLPVSADLLDEQSDEVKHDPLKLARIVVALTRGVMRVRDIVSSEVDGGGRAPRFEPAAGAGIPVS